MKVMISYFNNIRHFTPIMVPLSTAKWDPKWYRKEGKVYIDKRGVINGLRIEKLVFNKYSWIKLQNTDDDCITCVDAGNNMQNRTDIKNFCSFMSCYLEQLRQIDFKEFIKCLKAALLPGQIPVLIVHEKPDRLCAERYVLKQWFKENGYELEEVTQK